MTSNPPASTPSPDENEGLTKPVETPSEAATAIKATSTRTSRKRGQKKRNEVPLANGPAHRLRRMLTSRMASLAAIVIAVLWTIPTAGLFINSLRPEEDIRSSGWWTFPFDPNVTVDTYNFVLYSSGADGGLINYFVNSLIVTVPAVLFPVAFAAMAAYALSWIKFRGATMLFIGIFALQIVPIQMALIPLLSFFSQGLTFGDITVVPAFNLTGTQTFIQIWIAHTIFGLPIATFLLHNFVSQLPPDVMEAARVDGASHSIIFRKIVLPLITPALASIAIFQFLWVWNDFLVGLVFGGGSATQPLTVRLADMAGTWGDGWTRLPAAAFISILVPLLVFALLQRYFVRGLLAGSVKG